jgi:excinuclease ABC subunit A
LIERLDLKPLNEMPDLPVYGSEPRVKCKNLRGPWQEVQLAVHTWAEIDRPEFWQFLEAAVKGFERFTQRAQQKPEDVMPWKVLGQKWHLSRKGFPPGKPAKWSPELLEELCELLGQVAEGGEFLWNNQQLVHLCPRGSSEPWATIQTKKVAALHLVLNGPKQMFPMGRVAELGEEVELLTSRPDHDMVSLRFHTSADITPSIVDFFREHYAAVTGGRQGTLISPRRVAGG